MLETVALTHEVNTNQLMNFLATSYILYRSEIRLVMTRVGR